MKPTDEELTVMALRYLDTRNIDVVKDVSLAWASRDVEEFLALWEATREWRAKVEQAESNDLLEALWGGPKTVDDLEREGK